MSRPWVFLLLPLLLVGLALGVLLLLPGGHVGAVVMVGPIPIVGGTSPGMALAAMLLAVVGLGAMFFLPRFLSPGLSGEGGDDAWDSPSPGAARVRGGGVILLGPIPIGFGTDKRSLLVALGLALLLMVLVVALARRF